MVGDLLIGDDIPDVGWYSRATLGACVKRSSGTRGYITTFHGEGQNRKVYRRDASGTDTYLGTVDSIKYNDTVDATFVVREPISPLNLTNIVRLRINTDYKTGGLNYTAVPELGDMIVLFGQTSGLTTGRVFATHWNGEIEGKPFRDRLRIEMTGELGDSGGPVMYDLGNGEFSIIGIFNGHSAGSGVVTRWDNIERAFDVKLY